ncbi:MAG: nicotinate-nucleotide adenylyltransferase [Alphaproteobacteria bacterium]|nr:nicotinate-nucleotide adenylyltransferase [Alphaproteobacteria bacterium]
MHPARVRAAPSAARVRITPAAGRIGLLGGSFNPAHAGHRHISLEALKRLRLDRVWWLVSPQNPLKEEDGMAPLAEREALAAAVADHPRIAVSSLEAGLGTRYTIDTVQALKQRFPTADFVWLMGADNLRQLPRWRGWQQLFREVPIAVFARAPYHANAASGMAAMRFARARLRPERSALLAGGKPPLWCYLPVRRHPASATAIRSLRSSMQTFMATAPASPGNPDLMAAVRAVLDEMKALDVVEIDMRGKTAVCDDMVVASGGSQRHVQAIADKLVEALKPILPAVPPVEGAAQGDWVLIDGGDVIVHLFRPEVRDFYRLEKMWGSLPQERP